MRIDFEAKKARAKRIWQAQRDRLRGWSVNRKALGLAIGIEAAIIAAGAYAGYLFAVRYTGGAASTSTPELMPTDVAALTWFPALQSAGPNLDFGMAIAGALMLVACELARVPLAAAFRVHRHWGMRILALVAVIGMVGVTTKTTATVLGQAYHVRRLQVIEASANLKAAQADLATLAARKGSADTALVPLQRRVDEANTRIAELNLRISEQGKAPEPREEKYTYRGTCRGKNKRGKTVSWKCDKTGTRMVTDPWSGQQFADQLDAAVAERDAAERERAHAAAGVGEEVERIARQEQAVAEAEAWQRDAVMNSQLHDFASILLAKDAVDLTEGELNWFLRAFVLIPALLIAGASTALAMVSFTRLPTLTRPVEIPRDEDGTLAAFVRSVAQRTVAVQPQPASGESK